METTPPSRPRPTRWALFLDFDMVLNDQAWLVRARDTTLATNTLASWASRLDPVKLSMLQSFLTAHPFIDVILSTSWRLHCPFALKEVLSHASAGAFDTDRVVGEVGRVEREAAVSEGIAAYLRTHGERYEGAILLDDALSITDLAVLVPSMPCLPVVTRREEGLRYRHISWLTVQLEHLARLVQRPAAGAFGARLFALYSRGLADHHRAERYGDFAQTYIGECCLSALRAPLDSPETMELVLSDIEELLDERGACSA